VFLALLYLVQRGLSHAQRAVGINQRAYREEQGDNRKSPLESQRAEKGKVSVHFTPSIGSTAPRAVDTGTPSAFEIVDCNGASVNPSRGRRLQHGTVAAIWCQPVKQRRNTRELLQASIYTAQRKEITERIRV
jgi:hypothetical protein